MTETVKGVLSDSALGQFWSSTDSAAYKALIRMDAVDASWSSDTLDEVVSACNALGRTMESTSHIRPGAHQPLPDFMQQVVLNAMAGLKTSRSIRIFHWMESYQPVFAEKLLHTARNITDNDSAILFIERLNVLRRLELISRIFSYSRLKFLIDRLDELEDAGQIDLYRAQEQERLREAGQDFKALAGAGEKIPEED